MATSEEDKGYVNPRGIEHIARFCDGQEMERRRGHSVTMRSLNAEEIEMINNAPVGELSGTHIREGLYAYVEKKDFELTLFRGSGCGASVSGATESICGFKED